jgi:hypothetical protein
VNENQLLANVFAAAFVHLQNQLYGNHPSGTFGLYDHDHPFFQSLIQYHDLVACDLAYFHLLVLVYLSS